MSVAVFESGLISPCPHNAKGKSGRRWSCCFSISFEAESSSINLCLAAEALPAQHCPAALSCQLKYFSFLTQFFNSIFPLMFVIGVEFTFVLCIFSQWPAFHSSLENYLAWIAGISLCTGSALQLRTERLFWMICRGFERTRLTPSTRRMQLQAQALKCWKCREWCSPLKKMGGITCAAGRDRREVSETAPRLPIFIPNLTCWLLCQIADRFISSTV